MTDQIAEIFLDETIRALESLRATIEKVLSRDPSLGPSPEIRAGERLLLADTNRKLAILTKAKRGDPT